MNIHEKFISRAIQIAKNGIGNTYPNPSVGCVITHNNKIIGEGFSADSGGPHAEVLAIKNVSDTRLLPDSNLYVTLEPCSHYGKTPPCSDLIINNRIRNVYIGTRDPNPLVAGKGIEKLKSAGCKVTVGILENEIQKHHKRFLTFQTLKRPYIKLKWAQSKDGFIAPEPKKRSSREPVWLSNPYSRQDVHKLRATEETILIGTNTAIADNPSLTTRNWFGNHPKRIIIDQNLKIPTTSNCLSSEAETIVFNQIKTAHKNKTTWVKLNFKSEVISQILSYLYQQKIQSIIVEGGKHTLETFLNEELWDEAIVYESPNYLYNGIVAPDLKTKKFFSRQILTDLIYIYYRD